MSNVEMLTPDYAQILDQAPLGVVIQPDLGHRQAVGFRSKQVPQTSQVEFLDAAIAQSGVRDASMKVRKVSPNFVGS